MCLCNLHVCACAHWAKVYRCIGYALSSPDASATNGSSDHNPRLLPHHLHLESSAEVNSGPIRIKNHPNTESLGVAATTVELHSPRFMGGSTPTQNQVKRNSVLYTQYIMPIFILSICITCNV